MGGICGAVSLRGGGFFDRDLLARMNQQLLHRGPDDEGYFLDKVAGLGTRRLRIIDPSAIRQPVTNEDRTLWLVFDGEIYNFRELRLQLEARGHRFQTPGDSEVILHAYEEFGDDCPRRLNGMFAFAIWDTRRRRLFLARDHVGIKPLFYWYQAGQLVFGSEVRAVLAHPAVPRLIDPAAIDLLLTLNYIPAPRTIFQQLTALPAGHRLVCDAGGLRIESFWDVTRRRIALDEQATAEELTALIDHAVQMQLVSDAPLGAFLSGDLASGAVVTAMQQAEAPELRTFQIGLGQPNPRELQAARLTAQLVDAEHTEQFLHPDLAELAIQVIGLLDQPLADLNLLTNYLAATVARQSVGVVLSGAGAELLFAGDQRYVTQRMERFYRLLPGPLRSRLLPQLLDLLPRRVGGIQLAGSLRRFVEVAALPDTLQHVRWMGYLSDAEKAELYGPQLQAQLSGEYALELIETLFAYAPFDDELACQQYVDLKTFLPEQLLAGLDRMCMAASLELRVPLLDQRIVEFALNLPRTMKLQNARSRRILRRAMANRLPDLLLSTTPGNPNPALARWLAGPLLPLMAELLSEESLRRNDYFEPACVQRWMHEHLRGRADHSQRLWALLTFELWQRNALNAIPLEQPRVRVVG